jgi:excisionase family DNA binding protein
VPEALGEDFRCFPLKIAPMNLSPEWVKAFAEQAELNTREAADLLNIPPALLLKKLESGEIPHRKVGKARRIRFNDLIAYQERGDRGIT